MKTNESDDPMAFRIPAYRISALVVLLALFYAWDWMPFRVLQRDVIGWSVRMPGCDAVSFVHEGSPAIQAEGKIHFYTAECTYIDLLMIVAPFVWVFGARRRRNILRVGVDALLILGGNLVRCWAAIYLDLLGVDRFYAHDLPDYIIWWPTVALVVLLALRRDFGNRAPIVVPELCAGVS